MMSNLKIYNVIGIMSGTSMDGVDFSLISTDGQNYTKILFELNYEYSVIYKNRLKKLIKNLPLNMKQQLIYSKKNEKFITINFIRYIKKFMNEVKFPSIKVDLIGLSGQTILHNPDKGYSIQLGSGKEVNKELKIPVVADFRENDLNNGGQGAPIGSYYHKSIIKNLNKKACILNIGGIANITYLNKNN